MQPTMKGIAFCGDRTVTVRDWPMPVPGPGQVLVQLKRAAICGSDLHTYRQPSTFFADKPPWIPGHEGAGIVAELGSCCRHVKVGDRVTLYHYLGCGRCRYCLSGYLQFCPERRGLGQPNAPGPDADYIVVDERNCLLLPDTLSFEDGAFIACIAGTCYSALNKLRPNGQETLVILGQGPVGLTGTLMAHALGARVIGVDLAPERLTLSRELGADVVIDATQEDVVTAVMELTGGRGADCVFETSGSVAAHRETIDLLRPNGRAVFVGFGSRDPSVNLTRIIGKQLTLMGSFVMPMGQYHDLVAFILRHNLSEGFGRMITHRFRITEAEEAFRVADSSRAGKVIFYWD